MSAFIDAEALSLAVVGGLWKQLDVVESTGSTNADLTAQARDGVAPGRVLVSAHQSTGRGRLARRWEAPPDTSVATSVLVAPLRPLQEWGWLPLLVGMAVTDGVRAATGIDVGVKWPNDVLVRGRKLCGILCESVGDVGTPRAVLGWGVNVTLREDQLPVPTATSILLEGSDASATAITAATLRSLETWYSRWNAGEDISDEYRRRCVTIGQDVRVDLTAEQSFTGRAVGVASDGALIVSTPAGERTVVAGDVQHLRPAEG